MSGGGHWEGNQEPERLHRGAARGDCAPPVVSGAAGDQWVRVECDGVLGGAFVDGMDALIERFT